jgi:UMF1 family MFS transporter
MISIWMVICIAAYYVNSQLQFQILAVVVGLVMGGIQSLSRSTYSKLLPETEDNTSFFSFYDVMEKIGLIIGPIVFGTTTALTGSMRNAVIPLFVFFIIGMVILLNLVKKIGWLKAIND